MAVMVRRIALWGVLLLVVGGLIALVVMRLQRQPEAGGRSSGVLAVPVEVAPVVRGPIEERRTFNGSLEPRTQFTVAPKISGRIERLTLNLGDVVQRGQVVAELDDAEYVQDVAQAEADLAVARANLIEAKSALGVARREYERVQTLQQRGVASESQLDLVAADLQAREAELEVAQAQVRRAESAVVSSQIRLGYTRVEATWDDDDTHRIVSQRFVDPGNIVAANAPLVSVVDINPLTAVVFVTEKDYGRLKIGQPATLTTDAYPGETFAAEIARLSPVFQQTSRQARVELSVENPDDRLKPGMFARVAIVLDRAEDAVLVPPDALVSRGERTGVFVVDDAGSTVTFHPVEVGLRSARQVQVIGEGVTGRVVTLGHQLLDDGSAITIPADDAPASQDANPLRWWAERAGEAVAG